MSEGCQFAIWDGKSKHETGDVLHKHTQISHQQKPLPPFPSNPIPIPSPEERGACAEAVPAICLQILSVVRFFYMISTTS